MTKMIPVTKPYLPNREKLNSYIDQIYDREWLTNSGPLVEELTKRLEEYLGVQNLLLLGNGTLALQIAYRALNVASSYDEHIASEAITTPFTFVATPSSLKWEGIHPIFADLDSESWCLDPKSIESRISPKTQAIVPVHVYGNPCDVESIDAIAKKHDLKVIYDAAHAFGVKYKGESILNWGDASTLSFHATKIFHSIEGGAIVFKRKQDLDKAKSLINFGITGPDEINELGINCKMNEFQAAMGLCVLDEIEDILDKRKCAYESYSDAVSNSHVFELPVWNINATKNYAYFPIAFQNETTLLYAIEFFKKNGVICRRYFYPSLDELAIFESKGQTNKTVKVANRVLCVPLYYGVDYKYISSLITTLARNI